LKTVVSLLLWAAGSIYFFFAFLILSTCLYLLPKDKTYATARALFAVLLKIMGIRLTVTGREHIDRQGTYLIMGNHQSLFDIFVIPVAIPLTIVGVEAAYHFSIPLWGRMAKRWGNIPIARRNIKKAIASLEKAREVLVAGTSIGILPEGHRTLTGEIGEFKKGPFHLALQAGADILPFAISGLFEYNAKSSWKLNPGPVRVTIGRPLGYERFKTCSVEELRDLVRRSILEIQKKEMHPIR
jgi:1-acyl-sn-glycerol-3-phosphate acyltransferase